MAYMTSLKAVKQENTSNELDQGIKPQVKNVLHQRLTNMLDRADSDKLLYQTISMNETTPIMLHS